jgi:hypothetical protein
MKKLFLLFASAALLMSVNSCAKCVVCKDKGGDTFEKFEVCDKDYSAGDVDDAIDFYEADGYDCRQSSRII